MKIKVLSIFLFAALTLTMAGCKSHKEVTGTISTMAMETVSLGSAADGTITLRAWGSGRNQGDAIEQAKRTAVRDVLFKGIKKGPNIGSARLPLVPEVNAEEKYAVYFEPFFSPGGEYKKFVKEDKGSAERIKSEGVAREAYGVIVVVDRGALRQQLYKDGVLK